MDVVGESGELCVVANDMFPEAPLPHIGFAVGRAGRNGGPLSMDGLGEAPFDRADPGGEGIVAWRQGHQHMEMVGQDHGGFDGEGLLRRSDAEGVAKAGDRIVADEQPATAVGDDGKEVGSARNAVSA